MGYETIILTFLLKANLKTILESPVNSTSLFKIRNVWIRIMGKIKQLVGVVVYLKSLIKLGL